MTYPSKKDGWVSLLVLPIALLMPVVGVFLASLVVVRAAPLPVLWPGLILSTIGGFLLWSFFSTSCEITPADLIVRFGPLRWDIPLEGVTQIVEKKGLSPEAAWGVAWSLDRIVIQYRKRNGRMALLGVAVSVRDKESFLRDLAEAILAVRGPGETASGLEPKE